MKKPSDIFAIFPELERSGRTSLYVSEFASAVGISPRQVHELMDEGTIGFINISTTRATRKERRIPIGEYARFLAARASLPARAYAPKPTQSELF